MTGIGLLNEKSLHASLKQWCAVPGDSFEVPVDGYVIDIVRDGTLLEIQTGNFASIGAKLRVLSVSHPVRLIYPIPKEKWIIKKPRSGKEEATRRKSPKRGRLEDMFRELVSIPSLISRRNFSLEIVLTREEEVRSYDGRRGWRKKGWVTDERRLLEVLESRVFNSPEDLRALLPRELGSEFTTGKMSDIMGIRRDLAQKMAYCLRKCGVINVIGRSGRAFLYGIEEV